LTKKVK